MRLVAVIMVFVSSFVFSFPDPGESCFVVVSFYLLLFKKHLRLATVHSKKYSRISDISTKKKLPISLKKKISQNRGRQVIGEQKGPKDRRTSRTYERGRRLADFHEDLVSSEYSICLLVHPRVVVPGILHVILIAEHQVFE